MSTNEPGDDAPPTVYLNGVPYQTTSWREAYELLAASPALSPSSSPSANSDCRDEYLGITPQQEPGA